LNIFFLFKPSCFVLFNLLWRISSQFCY